MKEEELKFRMEVRRKVENYRKQNESIKKGQILFAGSSLMEMFPIEEMVRENDPDLIVYNRGIGGYQTKDLLQTMDTCVLDLAPSRMFLNIGTNDLSDANLTLDHIMDNYDQILTITEEKLPGIEIYLMAYYPVNYEAATEQMKPCLAVRNNEKIAQANQRVEKLAQKHGQKYIDVNAPLKDEDGNLRREYTIEGMHIKREGYAAIYSLVAHYMREPRWK